MEMDRKVIHSATKSQRVWKMYLKVEELAVWALGSSWGPAASIFISLPFTPCSYFALYNFTAAIYEPLLWASTAALLLFIAARRDHLSLDPPLLPFFLHLYRLCWVQSISLFPPPTPPPPDNLLLCRCLNPQHTHLSINFGNWPIRQSGLSRKMPNKRWLLSPRTVRRTKRYFVPINKKNKSRQ